MKACPQCATDLPDEARFCGNCGFRFDAEPEVAAAVGTPAEAPAGAAEVALGAGDNAAAHRGPEAPPDSAAGATSSFELVAEDYARALERICEAGDLPLPAQMPTDHGSFFEIATAMGLDKLTTEKALHRVSIEKLPEDQRRAMGIVLEDDIEPTGRSPWIPVIVGINLVAVAAIVFFVFLGNDPPERPPVELKPQTGTIDTAALEAAFDDVATQSSACYQAALKGQSDLKGDVVITLRIGLDGKATDVKLSKDELEVETVAACIVGAAATKVYPAAANAPVDVDLPLSFAPGS